jgi:MFS family permease
MTAASATVMRILTGRTSDTMGRRGLIVVGAVIFGISAASFNFFPFLAAMPIICLVRGFGMSMANTTLSVAITDVIPKQRMGEGLGYFGLTQPLTSVIGPAIATGLIATGSFSAIFYTSMTFIFVGGAVMFFCNYEKDKKFIERKQMLQDTEPHDSNEDVKKSDANPRGIAAYFEKSALPCSVLQLFISMAQGANLSFLMAYAFYINVPNPVLFYTFSAVFMVLMRVSTGRLADRFKPVYLIAFGIFLNAVSFTCMLFAQQNYILFYGAGIAAGIANGIIAPVMQATVVRMSPDSRRGAAMATYMFPMDLGIAIGGFIWGVVVDNSGYSAMYMGCVVCLCIAIVLSGILLRKVAPAQQKRVSEEAQ